MANALNYAETKAIRKLDARTRLVEALKEATSAAFKAHQSTQSRDCYDVFVELVSLEDRLRRR